MRIRLAARLRARARALRAVWITLAQTAVAAGLAWLLAHDVLGHKNAFFAPIAAVIALGLSPGGRTRRTVEMVIGVAGGIAVGELLISAIGTGAAQVGLVVLLAMGATIALGGGPLIASQAASSAVLVATVRTSGGLVPTRFVDALVGGAVGIGVLAIAPRDPAAMARRSLAPVIAGLSATLEDVATALETRDLDRSTAALERARMGDAHVARLKEALVLAEETTRIAPGYRRYRALIARYEDAAPYLEYAVRNGRVLARAAVRAVELEPSISPRLPESIRGLAEAVRRIDDEIDHGGENEGPRAAIVGAAAGASEALNETRGFAIDVLIGQVRSIAADLLGALGLDQATATEAIRTAAGEREAQAPRSRKAASRRGTRRA